MNNENVRGSRAKLIIYNDGVETIDQAPEDKWKIVKTNKTDDGIIVNVTVHDTEYENKEVTFKWDGCIDYRKYNNGHSPDEPYSKEKEESCDYIHICDLKEHISELQSLYDLAVKTVDIENAKTFYDYEERIEPIKYIAVYYRVDHEFITVMIEAKNLKDASNKFKKYLKEEDISLEDYHDQIRVRPIDKLNLITEKEA